MIEKRLGSEIGSGSEKRVFEDLENEDRVIGVFDNENRPETPQQVKARFYLTKILHLLLPKNIADMHWATSEPRTIQSDKLEHSRLHKILNAGEGEDEASIDKAKAEDAMLNDPSIKQLAKSIEEVGIFLPDAAGLNFSHDADGNALYMDTFIAWITDGQGKVMLYFDWNELGDAIETLGDDEKAKANIYLERLKVLYEEEISK